MNSEEKFSTTQADAPNDAYNAKRRLFDRVAEAARSGVEFGFSESEITERLRWFGISNRGTLCPADAREVTAKALRAVFTG